MGFSWKQEELSEGSFLRCCQRILCKSACCQVIASSTSRQLPSRVPKQVEEKESDEEFKKIPTIPPLMIYIYCLYDCYRWVVSY